MFVSFYYMPTDVWIATISYLVSEFLDAFDGHAARALNQCRCSFHNYFYFNFKDKFFISRPECVAKNKYK